MFLGLEMGKTGLTVFYHGWPYFIMAVVLMVFILVWFICERIVFPWKFVPKVNENDEKRSNEEKLKQQKINLVYFFKTHFSPPETIFSARK